MALHPDRLFALVLTLFQGVGLSTAAWARFLADPVEVVVLEALSGCCLAVFTSPPPALATQSYATVGVWPGRAAPALASEGSAAAAGTARGPGGASQEYWPGCPRPSRSLCRSGAPLATEWSGAAAWVCL